MGSIKTCSFDISISTTYGLEFSFAKFYFCCAVIRLTCGRSTISIVAFASVMTYYEFLCLELLHRIINC